MKKFLALFLAIILGVSLVSCGEETPTEGATENPEVTPTETPEEQLKTPMTYSEFMAAEAGDDVTIEGFIAAKQGWWDNKVTMYLSTDVSGEGYFIFEFPCTQEENNTVYKIGEYIHIEGSKTIYAGEHEIMGENITLAKVVETEKFVSTTPIDLTEKLASVDAHQNAYFTATLTVKEYTTTDENVKVAEGAGYGYKGDAPTDDLYFILTDGTNDLSCCVEYYLSGSDTALYDTVKNLVIGDKVTVEGYLYWWNGANPHIISIKSEVMSYEEFMAAEVDDLVVVEGFVAAKQGWWNNHVIVYLVGVNEGEGYLAYDLACSEEENNTILAVGNYVRIYGSKAEYAGLEEISNVTKFVKLDAPAAMANAIDLSNKLADLMPYQNAYFTATLTVKEYTTTDSNTGVAASGAYGYKGDAPTDDLYFILTDGTNDLSCCVEYYLSGSDTALYDAVKNLAVGETITITGYLYWWNGANPHIVSIVK